MPDLLLYSTQYDTIVDLLAPTTLLPLVSDALRTCQSLLALSRSPLANSPLVKPALVKDDVSPTAEERGGALRLVLRWSVEKLAPSPAPYPFGVFRPFDDPTWRDPRWWRYTILRHRYLEPLHPDDFTGGGRFTETLLSLTGISSADAFYDERNRAIGEAVEWLRRQLVEGAWSREIQQLALQETLAPLEKQPALRRLLAIATAFDEVFPREQLLALARREDIAQVDALLDEVIARRFLLTGDGGANLWLAPALRTYLYARQPVGEMQQRHRLIAIADEAQGRLLPAIRHYQRGGQDERAARLLLTAVDDLLQETPPGVLIELIQSFTMRRLDAGNRYALYLLLSDLLHHTGRPDEALAAGRQALQAARTPEEQARAYRRIGKLYETRNPQHALRYYQQAIDRFPAGAAELAEALKDRGWLYFLRQDWRHAEADLLGALEVAPVTARALQGAIYDALANLYRKTGDHARAVSYAELALALREEDGDLLGVAKSHGNLGLLYRAHGDYAHAIAAYTEAMSTYARLGNQELVAVALLNIGAAYFLAGDVEEALRRYQASLEISRTLGLPLLEIKAHYNLAEAYAASGQSVSAGEHWQLGVAICRQHAFDDQEQDFMTLASMLGLSTPGPQQAAAPHSSLPAVLDPEAAAVLALAQREHRLTAQRLVEALHVSRATATRRLTALAEMGYLQMEGKGRGVHYRLMSAALRPDTAPVLDIDARLRALLPALRQQFDVAAVGLTPVPGVTRLVVRFQVTPTLEQFFDLERHISAALQVAVDLAPESALDASSSVRWLND